jgi:catechol 2,3-dioxygenase-like lactoylglutathione lyase family enzyme
MNDFNPATYRWAALVPELLVSDFDRSLTFYRRLGFTLMYQREKFAYLEYQRAQFMIAERDDWWETGAMERPYGRGGNFQFSTTELDALIARLTSADIALYEGKAEKWRDLGGHRGGSIEFLVQDPDGYLLRFLQKLPIPPTD